MKKTVTVRKERHYKPHAEFYHAVSVHLPHVQEQHPGFYYSLLSAFLLSAFSLEAYLNYIGPLVEPGWRDFDRAATLAKLRHVACVLDVQLDASRRPIQTIIELFAFRNRMAHPRDSQVVEEYTSTPEDYQSRFYTEPRPDWFAFATEQNASRCYDDIGATIELFNSNLPEPEPFPLLSSGWTGSAS
jgi:hypothetical protein